MRCFHILYSNLDKSTEKTRRKRGDGFILHDVVPLTTDFEKKTIKLPVSYKFSEFGHVLGTLESTQLRNSFL